MKPRDRVLGSLAHGQFDRLPIKHLAVAEIDQMLYRHFGVHEENALLDILGHDFREIRPRYCGPALKGVDSEHGIISGVIMARAMQAQRPGVSLPLADITDVLDLDQFSYPIYDWYAEVALRAVEKATVGKPVATRSLRQFDRLVTATIIIPRSIKFKTSNFKRLDVSLWIAGQILEGDADKAIERAVGPVPKSLV